jgi:hypothetical protein
MTDDGRSAARASRKITEAVKLKSQYGMTEVTKACVFLWSPAVRYLALRAL